MNTQLVEAIANAVLYEGYILYPYRPSAVKNRQRFNFGVIYPEAYSKAQGGTDSWSMQTECLVLGNSSTELGVKVRFLQLVARVAGALTAPALDVAEGEEPDFHAVEAIEVDGQLYQTWQESVERDLSVDSCSLREISAQTLRRDFSFPAKHDRELLRDSSGKMAGALIRRQQSIQGAVEISAERAGDGLFKVRVRILNFTGLEDLASRDEALVRSLVSAHSILRTRGGEFVSLLDPPESLKQIAADCKNAGTYPVLAGEEGSRDTVLSSPIILYDYPQIAPESAGEFFDGTEIDEILALRIMTMTDQEKREMRGVDERARRVLERTESLLPEQMMKLHGVLRGFRPAPGDAP